MDFPWDGHHVYLVLGIVAEDALHGRSESMTLRLMYRSRVLRVPVTIPSQMDSASVNSGESWEPGISHVVQILVLCRLQSKNPMQSAGASGGHLSGNLRPNR